MNEREFTKQVIDVFQQNGWLATHFLPARVGRDNRPITAYLGDGKGFFDFIALRERLVHAELKIPPNKPTVEQIMWAQTATAAGLEVYLWTPDDYDDIVKVAKARRPAVLPPV